MAVNGGAVFLGGNITLMGGPSGPLRYGLSKVDAVTGAVADWNPNPSPASPFSLFISAVEVRGQAVYVGGTFGYIGGQTRNFIAALDAVSGLATPWKADADAPVLALALGPASVYAGGDFMSIGGQPQSGIAGIGDVTTADVPTYAGSRLRVFPPRPNPARDGTVLRFELPVPGRVVIQVFDLAGRRVRGLLDERVQAAGAFSIPWDGRDEASRRCAPGIYHLRIQAGLETFAQRLVLLH
jgi:hypothetical protein